MWRAGGPTLHKTLEVDVWAASQPKPTPTGLNIICITALVIWYMYLTLFNSNNFYVKSLLAAI